MGKERGEDRIGQLARYMRLLVLWTPRSQGVLIHMHPVYAIVAWLPSRLFGKRLGLWYTHRAVSRRLKLAHRLVDIVFTASPESFRLRSTKIRIMGHGINMERFSRTIYPERSDNLFRIVSVGRISPSKDYETLIKAAELLHHEFRITNHGNGSESKIRNSKFEIHIYGDPALPSDEAYLESLLTFVGEAGLEESISFHPGVPYSEVPRLYADADLVVNLSRTGSIDKTVLEAAASKSLVLTSNEAFYRPLLQISPLLIADNNEPKELATKIRALSELSPADRDVLINKLYGWVTSEHDIKQLAQRIIQEFSI